MNTRLMLLAALLGVVGLAAVEWAGQRAGVLTAITPYLLLDALVYALTAALLTAGYGHRFASAGRVARWGWGALYLLCFAPLAALLGAVAELTIDGHWGIPGLVQAAFVHKPINLIYGFVLDTGWVALPLGVASVVALVRVATATQKSAVSAK
jgi:hypothetical protein